MSFNLKNPPCPGPDTVFGTIMQPTTPTQLREWHLHAAGPKRILSVDGGGVRGILALAFLERIETILRQRYQQPDLVLSEYFDLVGGTSTGSIVATGIALGHPIERLIELYLNVSHASFQRLGWLGGLFSPKFDATALRQAILDHIGAETLGSARLQCGIGIVAKRLDTGSVWLFHNHPEGPYFVPAGDPQTATPNRDLRLVDLLRASSAAPFYFEPEMIEVAPGEVGAFVDGGVSPHNNPALLLLMLATLRGYGFRWPLGADRMLLVSIGTGAPPMTLDARTAQDLPSGWMAVQSLRSMMQDSNQLAQTVLQWMGVSDTPWPIDSEIGDLSQDSLAGAQDSLAPDCGAVQPLLRYLRYDAPLTRLWLQQNLGLDIAQEELDQLTPLDRPGSAQRLLEIGRAAAERMIHPEHLPPGFDVPAIGADPGVDPSV